MKRQKTFMMPYSTSQTSQENSCVSAIIRGTRGRVAMPQARVHSRRQYGQFLCVITRIPVQCLKGLVRKTILEIPRHATQRTHPPMLHIAQQRLLQRRLTNPRIINITKTAPHTRRPLAPLFPRPWTLLPRTPQPPQLRTMVKRRRHWTLCRRGRYRRIAFGSRGCHGRCCLCRSLRLLIE